MDKIYRVKLNSKGAPNFATAEVIDAVEVVRGEWIEYRPPTEGYCGMVECPFCGEELIGEPTDFNYCPNCGAKMKGADDE